MNLSHLVKDNPSFYFNPKLSPKLNLVSILYCSVLVK